MPASIPPEPSLLPIRCSQFNGCILNSVISENEMSIHLRTKILLAVTALIICRSASGDQISLQQGVAPTGAYQHLGSTIFQNNPDKNDGSRPLLGVGEANHAPAGVPGFLGHIRSVLAFGLSDIPAGSTINAVTLNMTVAEIEGDGDPGRIELFAITPSKAVVEGTGVYSVGPNNGVSWNEAAVGVPWAPGGDYIPTALASVHPTALGTVTFGPANALTSAAQTALDNGRPLQLLLIASEAEFAHNVVDAVIFHSDDAAIASNRPRLNVDYVPEPRGTVLMLPAVAMSLLIRVPSRSKHRSIRSGRNEQSPTQILTAGKKARAPMRVANIVKIFLPV